MLLWWWLMFCVIDLGCRSGLFGLFWMGYCCVLVLSVMLMFSSVLDVIVDEGFDVFVVEVVWLLYWWGFH